MRISTYNRLWGAMLVVVGLLPTAAQASQGKAAELTIAVAEACSAANQATAPEAGSCALFNVDRTHLTRDIFQYSFQLKVGSGEHDVITLHRVVRERAAGVPIRTREAIFMVHGDLWGFDAAFVGGAASGSVPRRQSIAIFLANRDVDVWGIDLRWVHVPPGIGDYSFMRDWSIGTHVQDLRLGLAAARLVRGITRSGFGQLALLGWSSGGLLAYAYASDETQYPVQLRHVKALIPVDAAFKFSAEHDEQRLGACQRYPSAAQAFESGLSHNTGDVIRAVGFLAETAPDGESPFFPGLTNRQGALRLVSLSYTFLNPPPVPYYHFTAGAFDQTGMPVALQFTQENYLYKFLQAAAPSQSFRETVEREALACNEIDLPYDDWLHRIRVPVLYVGAEGGFGTYGTDTLELLGSRDVSVHNVQLYPSGEAALDFAHFDLFLADNARELVWRPIYKWLLKH